VQFRAPHGVLGLAEREEPKHERAGQSLHMPGRST
jgi:hypothetical protein